MATKRNRSGRNDSGGSSSASGSSGSSGLASASTRKPMVRRTFIQRLLGKAETMYSTGTDISKMISGRGAPGDIEPVARGFIAVLEEYRARFFALRDSGWSPPESSVKADIREGDVVTIVPKFLPKYSYIPGLVDGTARLMAAMITPKPGKGADVLVKDAATDAPYGLIPKGHLVRA